jgi:hypothetical protein
MSVIAGLALATLGGDRRGRTCRRCSSPHDHHPLAPERPDDQRRRARQSLQLRPLAELAPAAGLDRGRCVCLQRRDQRRATRRPRRPTRRPRARQRRSTARRSSRQTAGRRYVRHTPCPSCTRRAACCSSSELRRGRPIIDGDPRSTQSSAARFSARSSCRNQRPPSRPC